MIVTDNDNIDNDKNSVAMLLTIKGAVHPINKAKALLKGQSFVGLDFSFANFSGMDLTNTQFEKCNFICASFKGAKIAGAGFMNCNLIAVDFTGAKFTDLDLEGLTRSGISDPIIGIKMQSVADSVNNFANNVKSNKSAAQQPMNLVNFTDSNLTSAIFNDAWLCLVNFTNAILLGAQFIGAKVIRCDFTGVKATAANFTDAYSFGGDASKNNLAAINGNLGGSNFTDAVLTAAIFTNAFFHGANFTNANLMCASFVKADVTKSIFTNATLKGVDFTNASMYKTDFREANVKGVNFMTSLYRNLLEAGYIEFLEGATYDNTTTFTKDFTAEIRISRKMINADQIDDNKKQ